MMYHQDGQQISLSRGNLHLNSSSCCSFGEDKLGAYVRLDQSWAHQETIFKTSVQTYNDTIIFTQHFPDGLQNTSLGKEEAVFLISIRIARQ